MNDPWRLHERVRLFQRAAWALFGVLAVRAVTLQVVRPRASAHGARPPVAVVQRAPVRGRIVDANGEVLAETVAGRAVDVLPRALLGRAGAVARLAAILGYDGAGERALRDALATWATAHPGAPYRARRNVDDATRKAIEGAAGALPGVRLTPVSVRRYPQGALTAHAVGTMAEVTPEELARHQGFLPGDRRGRTGVERTWEFTLREGATLVTSLELRLQRAAADAMGARSGAVVVLSVNDGSLLAYGSFPAVDPNAFERGLTEGQYRSVRNDVGEPEVDRVAQVASMPGALLSPNPWVFHHDDLRYPNEAGLTGIDLPGEQGASFAGDAKNPVLVLSALEIASGYAEYHGDGAVYQPRVVYAVERSATLQRTPPVVARHRVARERGDPTPPALEALPVDARPSEHLDAVGFTACGRDPARGVASALDCYFVGLAPARSPRVVVVVRVDAPAPSPAHSPPAPALGDAATRRIGTSILRAWQSLQLPIAARGPQ